MIPPALLPTSPDGSQEGTRLWRYYAIACITTWALALPTARAWLSQREPSTLALAGAGLSAFGPLIAVFIIATRTERREAFSRWRTPLHWVVLALFAPLLLHILARALFLVAGGEPSGWFFLPPNAEAIAALVVFSLGEEFGWRGYCYPKLASRYGLVQGSLILGVMWGVWHFGYGVNQTTAAFDWLRFSMGIIELTLYSLLITWVMEHAQRSMAVALAFHAGGHLDHLDRDPHASLMLHACHLAVLLIFALFAARSLKSIDESRRAAQSPSRGRSTLWS